MISRKQFANIDREVKESLDEAFQFIRDVSNDHNYILFLADGEYKERYRNSRLRLNPYTIDNREDRYKDESRQNFFIQFMQLFYSFPKRKAKTFDNEYRLTMEMMIYTHIWESKPFLKQLFRLTSLSNKQSYFWNVEVPEMGKHDFIRNEIRDGLKRNNLKLADVITKGFHTSLRNAFAHSEYQFDETNKKIYLDTYKGDAWDIRDITFDNWTTRFAYSALLSYHFFNEKVFKRRSLSNDFGTNEFLIIHPVSKTGFTARKIFYDSDGDYFRFYDR